MGATDTKTGEGAASSTAPGSTGDQQQQQTGQPNAGDQQQSGQGGKTADDKSGEGQKTGDQQQQPKDQGDNKGGKAGQEQSESKVPDKYELKVPEAEKAYVDDAALAHVEKLARAAGMSNAEAQAYLEDRLADVTLQANAWAEETKKHPTYGGDNLETSKQLAQKAINRVFPQGHAMRDSFNNFLARGGAGNNINVVAFLAEVGRLMGEDTPPAGKSGSSAAGGPEKGQQRAAVLYDHADSKRADGRG